MRKRGLFLCLSLLLWSAFAFPSTDGPSPEAFSVRSRYLRPDRTWGNERLWEFKRGGKGFLVLSEGKTFGELMLEGEKVVGVKIDSEEFEAVGKVLLTGGLPLPVDLLPPESPRVVYFRQKKGGLVFNYKFEVTVKELDETTAKPLVEETIWEKVKGRKFYMTEAKLLGQMALRQLWAQGFPWWLYEETPQRRSWLISWGK